MEIRNLTTFLKVAELRHFTHAAEALGYVQSTVTTQIQQLESEIGLPLFERIGKKVLLTTTGEELVAYANQIVGLCEQAQQVGKSDTEVGGVLRIGTVESLYVAYVEPLLLAYRKKFPKVQITIRLGSGRDLMADLGKNQLDLIYILDENLSMAELTPVLTRQEDIVFTAASNHPLFQQRNIPLTKIIQDTLVLTERRSIYREALERIAIQQGMEIVPSLEANNTSAIVRLLKQGAGISFLPRYMIDSSAAEGSLCLLDVVMDSKVEFWSQLLHHKNKWVSRPMQGFVELLQDALSSYH